MASGALVGPMAAKLLLAAVVTAILGTAATGIALTADRPGPPTQSTTVGPGPVPPSPTLPAFNLTWNGYYRLGLADCVGAVMMGFCPAHTYETEPLVEPLAKAGVRVDIPAATSVLEFELRWEGKEQLHLMIHGPMATDRSMPSYMAMGGTPGRLCVSIPGDEIRPGMWEVMAHAGSPGVQETAFVIAVNGQSPDAARVRAGAHGHPLMEDWTMDMRTAEDCRSPPAR